MNYITKTTRLTVLPKGQPVYSEQANTVSIDDESAGEFVVLEQHGHEDLGKALINPDEWPVLRDAVARMISECRQADDTP